MVALGDSAPRLPDPLNVPVTGWTGMAVKVPETGAQPVFELVPE
jgi:hypothetical protein